MAGRTEKAGHDAYRKPPRRGPEEQEPHAAAIEIIRVLRSVKQVTDEGDQLVEGNGRHGRRDADEDGGQQQKGVFT